MSPINDDVAAIKVASRKLNKNLGEATELIRRLDAALSEADVCIEANTGSIGSGREESGEIDDGVAVVVDADYYLMYGRVDRGRWGIGVRCVHDPEPENYESEVTVLWVRPLDACPRHMRLNALPRIPDLVAAIRKELERCASGLDEDSKAMTSTLEELRALAPSETRSTPAPARQSAPAGAARRR